MRYLYTFFWDCRRNGCVEGLFVATEDDVRNAIGKNVYFGEILGKHSEVYGTLEEGDVKKLDVEPEVVEKVTAAIGGRETWSGYNPLRYLSEEDSDE